jgi:membrane associated rhomboid family serine protease
MPFDAPRMASSRSAQPAINVPAVVLAVIAVLGAVHLGLWFLGPDWQIWSHYALAFIPARLGGGEPVAYPEGAQYWTFLTYALLHGDAVHLGSNSIWLLIFSTPLARRWGALRYLILLAVSAVTGAVAVLFTHWGMFIVVVGASASVSAVLAAAIPIMTGPDYLLRGNEKLDHTKLRVLSFAELLTNSRALAFAAIFLGMTLLTGASQITTGTAFLEERSVAWEAHLAGFLVGLLLFYLLDRPKVPPATIM